MSLYEIESMMSELKTFGQAQGLTPEEVEAQGNRLREIYKDDPRVKI